MNIQRHAAVPPVHYGSWDRLAQYLEKHGRTIKELLGWGLEGLVFSTMSKSAVKGYLHRQLYENERQVYFRLFDLGITTIDAFAVPKLLNYSDELMVIEMSVVSPPFILDFAGAALDKKPQWDDEIIEEWEREKIEQFGPEHWEEVTSALATLRGHKIYLSDVKPGNVTFPSS